MEESTLYPWLYTNWHHPDESQTLLLHLLSNGLDTTIPEKVTIYKMEYVLALAQNELQSYRFQKNVQQEAKRGQKFILLVENKNLIDEIADKRFHKWLEHTFTLFENMNLIQE